VQFLIQQLILAVVKHKVLKLIHTYVAVLVWLDLLLEQLIKFLLRFEDSLEVTVHFDKAILDLLQSVLRNLLRVKHYVVIIKYGLGFSCYLPQYV